MEENFIRMGSVFLHILTLVLKFGYDSLQGNVLLSGIGLGPSVRSLYIPTSLTREK